MAKSTTENAAPAPQAGAADAPPSAPQSPPAAPQAQAPAHPSIKAPAAPTAPQAPAAARPTPPRRNKNGHIVGEQLTHEQILALSRKKKVTDAKQENSTGEE